MDNKSTALTDDIIYGPLKDEGVTRVVVMRRERKRCFDCGEPATRRHSFLFMNYRSNPASAGYGKDDCSYCTDKKVFTCEAHRPGTPRGCDSERSTFPCTARFQHMFLGGKEKLE